MNRATKALEAGFKAAKNQGTRALQSTIGRPLTHGGCYASLRDSASATKPAVILWATIAVESTRATRKLANATSELYFPIRQPRCSLPPEVALQSPVSVTYPVSAEPVSLEDDKAACCKGCLALGWRMAEDARNAPVWWDREFDSSGRQIRADVRTAAHEIWPSACRQARSLLGDVSDAAEFIEQSVVQVSQYLDRAKAESFSQNTRGILMCAFCRALRRYAMKLNRLQLVGKTADLSERVSAPRWAALVNLRLDLEKLGCALSNKTREMFGLRSCGYEWKEIADRLHMSEAAARTAFWREIRRATWKSSQEGSKTKPTIKTNCEDVEDEH